MSIGSRSCPECAGPLDVAGKCRVCVTAAPAGSTELVAKAEALFASYLAARIVRARRTAKAAKIELVRDPRNREKASAAQAAEDEALRLQAQLVVHERAKEQACENKSTETAASETVDAQARAHAVSPTTATGAGQAIASGTKPHDEHQCPRCSDRVPRSAGRCRCGYVFELPENRMPTAFLTAAEMAALRGAGKRR